MYFLDLNHIHVKHLTGIASILGGLLIPMAFMLPGGNLEMAKAYAEVINGGNLDNWKNQLTAGSYREIALFASVASMFFVLLVGLILFTFIDKKIWQKYIALTAYIISCPLAAFIFIFRAGSERALLSITGNLENSAQHVLFHIRLQDGYFQIFHTAFVPVVLVFFGTGFMAWALLRSKALPKWLCYWGIIVSLLVGIGGFSPLDTPLISLLQITPLHFFWFIALGIVLLSRKSSTSG